MRGKPVVLRDFHGGVNTKEAAYNLAPNEARDARNVVSSSRGSIIKRNGDTAFSTIAGSANITDLFPVQNAPSGRYLIAVDDNAATAYSISTTGTTAAITGTLLTNLNAYIEAPIIGTQGPVYINHGFGTPAQWRGTAANTAIAAWTSTGGDGSSVPPGSHMVYFGNRVWISGHQTLKNRLFFSGDSTDQHLANPTWWNGGSGGDPTYKCKYVDINPDDGDQITGLGTVGPYILVFKKRHTYVVYDLDTGANRSISNNVGCFSRWTIADSPHGTFFLSLDQGVFVTDGDSMTQVSQKITPTLNATLLSSLSCGVYFNDHYYLSMGISPAAGGGTGFAYSMNLVLDYDTQLQSWWFHTNPALQYAVWLPDQVTPQLYRADALFNAHRVSRCYVSGTRQDNGSNFTAYWKGPWLSFDQPYRNKRLRQVHVDGSGTVDALLGTDFAAAGSIGTDIFTGATTQAATRLYNLGVGRAFSFEISGTHNSAMELDAYTMALTPRQN